MRRGRAEEASARVSGTMSRRVRKRKDGGEREVGMGERGRMCMACKRPYVYVYVYVYVKAHTF